MTDSANMTFKMLAKCWKEVEYYYNSNSISSERSLQSMLFESLRRNSIENNDKVLIEPCIDSYIPDIVIVSSEVVRCIIEIKCAPHYWITDPALNTDIRKLREYSKLSEVALNIFGPKMIFDPWKKEWKTKSFKYAINENTLFCFAVIALKNAHLSKLQDLQKYIPDLLNFNNFCLLSGAVTLDLENVISTAEFNYEIVTTSGQAGGLIL